MAGDSLSLSRSLVCGIGVAGYGGWEVEDGVTVDGLVHALAQAWMTDNAGPPTPGNIQSSAELSLPLSLLGLADGRRCPLASNVQPKSKRSSRPSERSSPMRR